MLSLIALAAGIAWGGGQTLVVVNDVADPVSLDPHREFDASSENVAFQLYDGLVRFSEDGRIEPALAESWTRVDERTMEFKLRPGVVFHNGEPCDAEAVRASVVRQFDPKNPAPNAALLGKLSAVVVDSMTVRLVTEAPDGTLLNKLPIFMKILPPKYLKEVGDAGFAARPVGTGPFVFTRWEKGRGIELSANPRYWMKDAPKLERLVFKFLPIDQQIPALLSGEVDLLSDLSGLDTLKVASHPETRVVKVRSFYAMTLLFNTRKPPFLDARARRAVMHALDRKDLIRYGAKGNAVALEGLTMEGQFGHRPGLKGYPFDLKKARALLNEAGVAAGTKIRLQVREELKSFGKILAAQLAEAGLDAEPYFVSQQAQFQELAGPKMDPSLPPFSGDIVVGHYVDPTVHVYFPYSLFLYSKSPYSLVSDPAADALFSGMTEELEPERQKELAWKLEELAVRECWTLAPLQILRPFGLRKAVRYEPYITGMLDFRKAEVVP